MMSAACICNLEKGTSLPGTTLYQSSAHSTFNHLFVNESKIDPHFKTSCLQIRGDWIEIVKVDGL